jgi:tRNA nucleotidyltransferase/poly(A) polymerase
MNSSLESYFLIQEKIDHKISRERIGIEVQKMAFAASSDPVLCFSYLVNFGLFHVVFKLPPTLCESKTERLIQLGT